MKTSRQFLASVVLAFVVCGVAVAADEIAQIKDLERQTWEVYVKRDLAGLEKITAPDFIFYDGESTQNWEQTKKGFATEIITSYKLGDMNVLHVSRDEMILSYEAELLGTQDGKDISGRLSVASAWVKRNGKWLSVFVHEVPLPKKAASQESTPMQLKVDHAGLCAYELKPMQDAFAQLGLATEYGGAHVTGGTHNALLGFDDGSYLELIAPQSPGSANGDDAQRWTSLQPDRSSACFWAMGVPDIHAIADQLRTSGFEVSNPRDGSRKKPDGSVIAWSATAVNEGKEGELLPFFIQDKTPRSARIHPSPSVAGGDVRGVEIIVIGVKNLDEGVALYRRAFGLPAPEILSNPEFAARMAYFPGTPVLLAAPLDDSSWIKSHLDKFGRGPVALLLGTKNFAVTSQRLHVTGNAVWFNRKVAWLDADKLHGARLGIVE